MVLLRNYTIAVFNATKNDGWDGDLDKHEQNTKSQWSFPGALLFSITVITTIGILSAFYFYETALLLRAILSDRPSVCLDHVCGSRLDGSRHRNTFHIAR